MQFQMQVFRQGVIQVAGRTLLTALHLLLCHLDVLYLNALVCSYRGLEVDMMQMCPYLQARYHCFQ